MACCQGMLPYCHGYKWRISRSATPSWEEIVPKTDIPTTTTTASSFAPVHEGDSVDSNELAKLLNDIDQLDDLLAKDDDVQALIMAGESSSSSCFHNHNRNHNSSAICTVSGGTGAGHTANGSSRDSKVLLAASKSQVIEKSL